VDGSANAAAAALSVTVGRWAIVIPGSGELAVDGRYRLRPVCHRCLEAAADLAVRRRPDLIVFSGWSPHPGPTEAEQMLEAWPGRRDIELVAEPTASITAENMARSLPFLTSRGVDEVTLVCALVHLPRVRYFFGGVYPRHGIRCRYSPVTAGVSARAIAWEAAALPLARRQRKQARAEIARGL
jgi:hypothetical protein